jgi:hypothetical protein
MWKDFTWNYKWNFTCEKIRISHDITNYKLQSEISHVRERISHEITTEISHVKGFHMKLQITCTSEISRIWKDFTWNYKVKFHMYRWKYFTWNYDWNFTCERFRKKLQITMKFLMWKDFTWNYKQWRRQASEIGGGFEGQTHILEGQDRIVK